MNVLITGASGGLGRALATECASRGWRLFLTDINAEGLNAIRAGLQRRYSSQIDVKASDLTDEHSVDSLLQAFDSSGYRFDMLLNVAGCDYEGSFMQRSDREVQKIVSLNISATLRITHALLDRRRSDNRFYLVFVSSLASFYPMPLKATYAASKRFLLDIACALKEELKDSNARVLALCPGGLTTTEEAMDKIRAQGLWGDLTTNRLELVSRTTIDRALAGNSLYIPGFTNRMLFYLGKLVPRRLVAHLLYRRWQKSLRFGLD